MKLEKYRMLLLLSSAWMIGAGLRFIMMKPTDIYTYSLFDKFFDWGIMFTLGCLLFTYNIYTYIKETQRQQQKDRQDKLKTLDEITNGDY